MVHLHYTFLDFIIYESKVHFKGTKRVKNKRTTISNDTLITFSFIRTLTVVSLH